MAIPTTRHRLFTWTVGDITIGVVSRDVALVLQGRLFKLMACARCGDYCTILIELDDPGLKAHLRRIVGREEAGVLTTRVQIAYGGTPGRSGLTPIGRGELLSALNGINHLIGKMAEA